MAEKIIKYQDLARKLTKLWNKEIKVIPIIIGTLGTTPKALPTRLKEIWIATRIVGLQKTVLLQSARILQQVLEMRGNLLTKLKNINPLINKQRTVFEVSV